MDAYYPHEQRTTAGFMRMARQGLRMIDVLAADLGDTIRGAFLKPPLLELSAHAIVTIINTLVGAWDERCAVLSCCWCCDARTTQVAITRPPALF